MLLWLSWILFVAKPPPAPQVTGLLLGGSALLRACGRTHFGARKLIQGVGRVLEAERGDDGEGVGMLSAQSV